MENLSEAERARLAQEEITQLAEKLNEEMVASVKAICEKYGLNFQDWRQPEP